MRLRDTIELWGEVEPPGEDSQGNPIPGKIGKVADCAAQVYYSTAGVEFSNSYGRLVATEKLRAIIRDPGVDVTAPETYVVWRGSRFRVDGVLTRAARGDVHHLTLELSDRR